MEDKRVKALFIMRAVLWVIALAATVYWIYWSFKLYELEIYDPYSYAKEFRPIFTRGLLISGGSICISLSLRGISDRIKRANKKQ